MPPFAEHIHREISRELTHDVHDLDFDPDKLIEPKFQEPFNPESVLTDQEALLSRVEGLDRTRQGFETLENGNTVFDMPHETGETLNSSQGCAIENVEGDCGLVSAENVARLAGKHVTEADVFKIASESGLCETGNADPGFNGGTTFIDLCAVLEKLGIGASPFFAETAAELADVVESGRGVIAGVDAGILWEGFPYDMDHAVTVTSVERNADGRPVAFYICDSGTGGVDSSRRVDSDHMMDSLSRNNLLVITNDPIR